MRAPLRLAARILLGAVLVAGWLSLFLAVGLFVAEKTGFLRTIVRDFAAASLGSVGDDLAIGEVRLRWCEPGIELERVELGRQGEWLRVDHAHLRFAVSASLVPRLTSAEIRGGRLRVSRALVTALEGNRRRPGAPSTLARRPDRIPTVRVEGFDVEFETARLGTLPLGRVDALLRAGELDRPELWGRMVPSLAASAADSGEIFLHGRMRESDQFEVHATATRLPIGTDYLPADSDFDGVRALAPRGFLELDASGTLAFDGRVAPRASARLSVHDGSVSVRAQGRRVEDVQLDVAATWAPASLAESFDPRAWSAQARAHGVVDSAAYEFVALLGPEAGPGSSAKAWMHTPRLPLGATMLDLCGNAPAIVHQWQVFDPRGECEAWAAVRLRDDFRVGDDWARALQVFATTRFAGATGMTFHGYEGSHHQRDEGFPLPLEKVTGDLVFARDATRERPVRVALVDLAGDDGSGSIRCTGIVQSPPASAPATAPGHGGMEFDLSLTTRGLAVDERLFTALNGLSGSLPPATTWEPFRPTGGNVDVDFRIAHTVDVPWAAIDLDVRFNDVSVAWNEVPIPMTPKRGRLRFRSDGADERALSFRFEGPLRTATNLSIAGRLQTDVGGAPRPKGKELDEIAAFELDVTHASMTGEDLRIFLDGYPEIRAETEELSPKGFADVRVSRVRHRADAPTWTRAEVTPRDPAQLTPRQFQMITTNVRGRALIGAVRDVGGRESVRTRLEPLIGSWGNDVAVAFTVRFPERTVVVFGAGIDPSSKSLLGSLRQAMSSSDSTSVDTAGLELSGALDFMGEIRLSEGDGAKNQSNYRFFLHDTELRTADGFALDHVRGSLTVENGELRGPNLRAWLANTPVTLTDTRFHAVTDGFELETRFDATGVPIDRDHLTAFVDPKTLDALLGELAWRGSVDVHDGRILVRIPAQGSGGLEFKGSVVPHDMSIQLGLPVRVDAAAATFERLVYEGGKVRAKIRIDGFHGALADRRLENASMLVTYVEPKLSIEDLTGTLEGGRVEPLGGDAVRRGTVFSIALEPPFGFLLALRMEDVEAAGLLRGLFPEDMATRGKVRADLQLAGDMDHLLGIKGSGSIRVLDSRLWSIPVFRALFAQLGFDDTAVFDSMATNLLVADGRVGMRDITVRSPLLQLVGSGGLDFDGGLHYDLEVRYDLIDRLGPFTRLLYSIQNKLLSVAIRGDMARPEIAIRNPFSSLFGGGSGDKRPLPLPPWASLPPRF